MGWKIVRDRNEEWCRAHGVSGQWRTSPDPAASLRRKIFEEAGEYAEGWDPAELYDLFDVVVALIPLEDPDGAFGREHAVKVAEMGGFTRLIEWCPVPDGKEAGGISHDERCCMTGNPPGAGPHPDCPGYPYWPDEVAGDGG